MVFDLPQLYCQPILLLYLKAYLTCIVCSYNSGGNVKQSKVGSKCEEVITVISPGEVILFRVCLCK